jgi:hypothetical protein
VGVGVGGGRGGVGGKGGLRSGRLLPEEQGPQVQQLELHLGGGGHSGSLRGREGRRGGGGGGGGTSSALAFADDGTGKSARARRPRRSRPRARGSRARGPSCRRLCRAQRRHRPPFHLRVGIKVGLEFGHKQQAAVARARPRAVRGVRTGSACLPECALTTVKRPGAEASDSKNNNLARETKVAKNLFSLSGTIARRCAPPPRPPRRRA